MNRNCFGEKQVSADCDTHARTHQKSICGNGKEGCITCGVTVESADANAQDAKKTWLEAARDYTIARNHRAEMSCGFFSINGYA
jgi:hypothetical protein